MTDKLTKIDYSNDLIFGKDKREGIVSIEVVDDEIVLFYIDKTFETLPMTYWILSNKRCDKFFYRLEGNNHYKFMRTFDNKKEMNDFFYKKKNSYDLYKISDPAESAMVYYGITLFKNLKVEDLGVLSFDIEADALARTPDSTTFLITNTYKKGDFTDRVHFRLDDYDNPGEMIEDWCNYVRDEIDPDVINGHNIFGYDLDYLKHVGRLYGKTLVLGRDRRDGRDGSDAYFNKRESKYRVDGSQEWNYTNCSIHGRHVIDGMFLSVKHDIGRNYPSWGLKPIAEYEGIITDDRQFYDASKIGTNWHDPIEREKIIKYGIDDSDDSSALYYLQIPSFFYLAQSIPKSFQRIINSASGSWLNSIMVRSYLQEGKSIPKKSEGTYVAGGMSHGIPGVYSNVTKWDADSYYPNTILTFDIYDKKKDPEANFLEMVRYFTNKRFEQKDKYKETGNKHYDDLQASSKIFINSAYGLLATPGLNFNSYKNAELITACCRKGLQKCVVWATGKDIDYWWGVNDKLYKEISVNKEDVYDIITDKYQDKVEFVEENEDGTLKYMVPRTKTKNKDGSDNWKVCYRHSRTATQDFKDYKFIDSKAKNSFNDMPRHDWQLVNLDTDSLSFVKKDQSEFTEKEYEMIDKQINEIMYSGWSDDGMFDKVLVVKAKNYILKPKGSEKLKIKGSSFLSANKEIALSEMLQKIVGVLIEED